jgi:hypothetical protein
LILPVSVAVVIVTLAAPRVETPGFVAAADMEGTARVSARAARAADVPRRVRDIGCSSGG